MEFLDIVKIGSYIKINVNLSKDRLSPKTLEALSISSTCLVKDFRLTDGKGIGVIVQLPNNKDEWFFENEIEILDEKGKVVKRKEKIYNDSFIKKILDNLEYNQKSNFKELINPINFASWLIFSLKDIF